MSSRMPENTPTPATLVDLLQLQARRKPDQPSYTFLLDGEQQAVQMTYRELDRRARAIATLLQRAGAAGERALLIYPPGLDYIAAFFGCLYAGVTAVPAYPPQPERLDRTLPRLQAIVKDAQARFILTNSTLALLGKVALVWNADFRRVRWIATDNPDLRLAEQWQAPAIDSDTLAFLQYTSGSTATPKGVMLSHRNLLHNLEWIYRCFDHSPDSHGVIWLPPYHDMGLIGGILQPLYAGFPVTLMSPVAFLQRPVRWLEAIARYRATTSGGPNFAYDLCIRKTTPEQRAALDLSSWKVAFNGAEPIQAETMERFAEAFAPSGFKRTAFYPCYGLAEATLIVSGGAVDAAPITQTFHGPTIEQRRAITVPSTHSEGRTLVGCGTTLADQQIVLANPETLARCQPGEIGEIWVAGASVAQGYWNRPEATRETFHAFLSDTGAGPFLRTGDLGYMHNGELFVTGRLKDLIIIRGRNLYPQDIERSAERSHPLLRPGQAAAFSVDVAGEEQLVVVHEVHRHYQKAAGSAVIAAIRQAIAEQHEISVYAVVLLKAGTINKTSSGKIQRHACRAAFLANTLNLVAQSIQEPTPATATAEPEIALTRESLLATAPAERQAALSAYLRQQLAQFLHVPAAAIDPQQPISGLGLDSLRSIELQHQIESRFGLLLPMERLLQGSTIEQLAQTLLADLAAPPPPALLPQAITSDPETLQPLSYGQRALWFLHQLDPESAAYNIANAVRIHSALDIPALQRTFQQLVARHPALRSSFVAVDGEPKQQIHAKPELTFVVEDAISWNDGELAARLNSEAQRPFDLEQGPLLRVHLFVRAAQEAVLLLVVHHIVADLWTLALLMHELTVLYPAEQEGNPASLPPLMLQYSDYVYWQQESLRGPYGERLLAYWQEQLAGELPTLDLPTDYPRPLTQSYRGAAHAFTLNPELTRQVKELARSTGTTLFAPLITALQTLLYRYTGQTDILIGTPTTGRSRAQLADLAGYLVNPVVLRARLAADLPFHKLLERNQQTLLGALDHQDYPFPLLVERLQPVRDPARSPLFQVMFVLEQPYRLAELSPLVLGQPGRRTRIGGLELEAVALEQQSAQFDLSLVVVEDGETLNAVLQYNSDLFAPATIARMAEHLQTLLAAAVVAPEQALAALPLLTAQDRQLLLHTRNATAADYPSSACIHDLFAAQAARTPNAPALVVGTTQVTYAELQQRAYQLAHYLRSLGVGPETPVGIAMPRSVDMVVGLLGIMAAGGAYVPLDPAYPAERLALILDDTRAPVLLTQASLRERVPSAAAQIVCMDDDQAAIAAMPTCAPERTAQPDNLAYVIYTSGSTGRPKGVAISHRNAVVMLSWARDQFSAAERAGMLAATSLNFDLAVFELFLPLSWGGTVILAEHVLELHRLPAAQSVTLINTVPSAMAALLHEGPLPANVRVVNLAGEPLPAQLVADLYAQPGVSHVWNLYGPSEDTTYSTGAIIERELSSLPPIGRPIANTQVYLLDERLELVPPGVVGELYLGGLGLARGYLQRPDLTAERFIPNPFVAPDPGSQSARLYKTGDRARYRADGQLEFLGRLDQQVKIRGFRIEPGEIEARLRQHPAVREAVVLVREATPGDRRLVAYLAVNDENVAQSDQGAADQPASSAALQRELRDLLSEQLPDYMIPAAFVLLTAMPLLPNGKIDRRALPAPDWQQSASTNFVAPRTPTEEVLAAIWAEVLGVERVSIHANFFDLGGHSLLATQALSRVRKAFQVNPPLRVIFEKPSIAGLAAVIDAELARPQARPVARIQAIPRRNRNAEQFLSRLAQFSEEEARQLLQDKQATTQGEVSND